MNRFPACLGASREKEPRCGFEEWFSALKSGVCSPPQLGEEWSEVCLESRAPPPQCGKPTFGGDSPCLLCAHGLRRCADPGGGLEAQEQLGLGRHKAGPQ